MNKSEIVAKWNTLTDRERDAWVAEVVFGWESAWEPDIAYDCAYQISDSVPNYTKDIYAAWAVFETFDYVEVARIPGNPPYYGARINGTDGNIRSIAQGETFPEAICLAAIIAKLTEVER